MTDCAGSFVKYLVMIFNNPDAPWSESEQDIRGLQELMRIDAELRASGELISSAALDDPSPVSAKTVRAHGGMPAITDGPFGESKEHLAGYIAVQSESMDRIVQIAGQVSAAVDYAVELRRIVDDEELRAYQPTDES